MITDADLRLTRQNAVDVHLFHLRAAILDNAARDDLEILQLRVGVRTVVGFDEADHDVEPARPQRVAFLQHRVGLADAGSGADVDAQARALAFLEAREERFGVYSFFDHCASNARLSSGTLTRGSPR